MQNGKPRTISLTLTLDRGMLLVHEAGNAGSFVLAMPDDEAPVTQQLRALVADASIPERRPGATSIDWGETARMVLTAITAPKEETPGA
jgi:hypothetical protein